MKRATMEAKQVIPTSPERFNDINTPPSTPISKRGLDTERKQTQRIVNTTIEDRISQLADDTQPTEE